MDDLKKVLPIRSPSPDLVDHANGLRIGKVMGVDAMGQFLVEYEGTDQGLIAARLTSSANEKLHQGFPAGQEVLLGFDQGDLSRPIIIDTLSSLLHEAADPNHLHVSKEAEAINLDRKERLLLDAKEEVVLQCGEASITLTRAGKVLIKGSYLVSRSSGTNCIKGSSVRIN